MSNDTIYRLLRADGSLTTNKNLIFSIGLNEAIIFSELLSRYYYFEARKTLEKDDIFFNTVDDLYLGTGLGDRAQRTAIKNLVKLGLLATKNKGVPPRRYFKLNFDTVLIEKYLTRGQDIIDIKREEMKQKNELSLANSTIPAFARFETANTQELKVADGGSNNTKPNNTNFNNTNLIGGEEVWVGSSNEPSTKSISYFEHLMKLVKNTDSKFKSDIVEATMYYYGKYFETYGEDHIRYTDKYSYKIIEKLNEIFDVGVLDDVIPGRCEIDLETFKTIADKHFTIEYKQMSPTLLSFLNDRVLIRRFYEECY